ncbi:MAG TPA: STAS domain-containing protein [Polyangia bacterium]
MFEFERSERDGVTVLTLAGSLDAATSAGLKTEVVVLSDAGKTRVAVDLGRLTLIDSTGVGVLISLFKRARAAGGAVHFAAIGGQPKEIFRLLRLDRSLDLHPTLADALAKLKG